jgi:hypothetical protein
MKGSGAGLGVPSFIYYYQTEPWARRFFKPATELLVNEAQYFGFSADQSARFLARQPYSSLEVMHALVVPYGHDSIFTPSNDVFFRALRGRKQSVRRYRMLMFNDLAWFVLNTVCNQEFQEEFPDVSF